MPPTADPTPAKPEKMIKLPGRQPTIRLGRYGQVTLYLAETYLLQIEVISWREVYQKFAYKDIQAIEVLPTQRWAVYNYILGALAGIFVVYTVFSLRETTLLWTLSCFAGFFLVLLLTNLVRGRTCRVILQTATGLQPLRSLARLKKTRRALAMLNERIDAVQGTLDQTRAAQEMETFLLRRAVQQRQRTFNAGTPAPVQPAAVPQPAPESPY